MAQITQEQYNSLVAKGLSPAKIKSIATSKGLSLPGGKTGLPGFVTGLAKGATDIAVGTARTFQDVGQIGLAAISPMTYEQVKETTGIPSLDLSKREGQNVQKMLETPTTAEKTGKLAANVVTSLIPTSKGAQIAGRISKNVGEQAIKTAIGISAKEARLVQAYQASVPLLERLGIAISGGKSLAPITNAVTAARQGLWGTETMIGVQARRATKNIWNEVISPALKSSSEKVNMKQFIGEIFSEVKKVPELSRRKELTEALKSFASDYGRVGDVSLEQLQKFKEGWAKFLPDKVYKGKPISGSFREIQNMSAQLARNKIYKSLDPSIREAYFDYGNLLNLQKMGQTAMTGAKLKGGAGSFAHGIWDMAVTPIATTGGKALYQTGRGLEFIGNTGLKTVGQLFGMNIK